MKLEFKIISTILYSLHELGYKLVVGSSDKTKAFHKLEFESILIL